jgi:hypothetical protein
VRGTPSQDSEIEVRDLQQDRSDECTVDCSVYINKHDPTPLEARVRVSGNGSFWLTTTKPVPNHGDVVHVTMGRVTRSYRVSNMRRGLRSRDRENLRVGELIEVGDEACSLPR